MANHILSEDGNLYMHHRYLVNGSYAANQRWNILDNVEAASNALQNDYTLPFLLCQLIRVLSQPSNISSIVQML